MPKKRTSSTSVRQENVSLLRTSEMLAKFLAAQGIPYDVVNETTFRDLFSELNPTFQAPTPAFLEEIATRMSLRGEKSIPAEVKTISVTFDVFGTHEDEVKMLAFSVHFTPWIYGYGARTNVVYLRRIGDGIVTGSKIIDCVREQLNRDHKQYSKIENIVIPNETLAKLFNMDNDETKHTLCFNHSITRFVESVLRIPEIANILEKLRRYIRHVRNNPEIKSKWQKWSICRIQITRTTGMLLPVIDFDGKWQSTAAFLEHFIRLDESFRQLETKHGVEYNVPVQEIQQLISLNNVLDKCLAISKDVSVPQGTISQLIPSCLIIQYALNENFHGCNFQAETQQIYERVFQSVLHGNMREQYEAATLLDPRYGYRLDLYAEGMWNDIESNVVRDFIIRNQEEPTGQEWKEVAIHGYRTQTIQKEIALYKEMCDNSRLIANNSVGNWWIGHQKDIPHLAILAREYAVCPITTVDAQLYFGAGGKFAHFSKIYQPNEVDHCLKIAGYEQLYRGSGMSFEPSPETFQQVPEEFQQDQVDDMSMAPMAMPDQNHQIVHLVEDDGYVISPSKRVKMEEIMPNDGLILEEQKPGMLLDIKQEGPSTSTQHYMEYEPVMMMQPEDDGQNIKNEPVDYLLDEDEDYAWEEYVDEMDPAMYEDFDDDELEGESSEQQVVPSSSASASPPIGKSRRKRYCALCGKFQEARYVKEVTIITEKLLILYGAVQGNTMAADVARALFGKSRLVVCRTHFVETCIAMFDLLHVTSYEMIATLPEDLFSIPADIVESFSGKRINLADLRTTFTAFAQKYKDLTTTEFQRIDYEMGSADGIQPPPARGLNTSCFCCGSLGNRELMVRMPENAFEWTQWMKILSVPFNSVDECMHETFICKTHFTPDSFTRVGRLRKGVLPIPPPIKPPTTEETIYSTTTTSNT